MIKNSTRHNRLVDSSPVPYVEGGNEIRFSLKSTGNAFEMGSFNPVPFVDCVACRALPAGIVWFDHNDGNARFLSFVFNEHPKLAERPGVVNIPVAFPDSCPHPDAIEILNGDGGRDVSGFPGDLLRYGMVVDSGESAFFAGKLLQMSLCGFRSGRLQPGTEISVVLPRLADLIVGIIFLGENNGYNNQK